MATIKKTTTGKYEVRYDFINEQGKRIQKKKRFIKKKEAEIFLNNTMVDIQDNTYIEEKNIILSSYLDQWLEHHKSQIALTTYEGYKTKLNHVKKYLGNINVQKLSAIQIQKFYTNLLSDNEKISQNTIIHLHKIFSKSLNDAYKINLIKENPCNRISLPKHKKHEAKFLQVNEVITLLEYLKDSDIYCCVLLAVMLGLRRGEVLGLKWSDVDFKNNSLFINNTRTRVSTIIDKETKSTTSTRRLIMGELVSNELQKELLKQKSNRLKFGNKYNINDYVCKHEDGTLFEPSTLSQTFRNRIKRVNITQVSFHELRHTNASMMLESGISPKVASERLGHSTIKITMDLYTHVLESANKEVASKLDSLISIK